MKATKQRAAVIVALKETPGFRSAQQLHGQLQAMGASVGLTTVYRTLQRLAAANEVDVVQSDAGESLFRLCATSEHHHHIVCTRCGRSVELESDEIESWVENSSSRHGYTATNHVIEIFGMCGDCGPTKSSGQASTRRVRTRPGTP
jgi:Fur family ferric uptake transcriptional regulator